MKNDDKMPGRKSLRVLLGTSLLLCVASITPEHPFL